MTQKHKPLKMGYVTEAKKQGHKNKKRIMEKHDSKLKKNKNFLSDLMEEYDSYDELY